MYFDFRKNDVLFYLYSELFNLSELTDKDMLIETLQDLFDNGIININ
jgi:hypothetical protein